MPAARPDLAAELLAELGWVRRLARRLVGDGADDLTQEVAALALERRPRHGLRAWLGAVTRRRAARWWRERARHGAPAGTGEERLGGDDPAAVVMRLQQQRLLAQAVLELPEPYRSVLVRRFLDGLAPREIARRRGVPAATVRQQLHRGLAMLRARLERTLGPDWRAGLGALLLPGVAPGTWMLGGAVMTKKALVLGAGLAAALLVVWWSVPLAAPREAPEDAALAARRSAAESPAPASPSPTAGAADRVAVEDDTRAPLRVRVVTEAGAPVTAVRVMVHARGVVRTGRTDADGVASFEGDAAPGDVLVLPGSRPPVFRALAALRGAAEIVLPDGARVAGHVFVFDRPLPRPVGLELRAAEGESFLDAELPVALQQEIEKQDARELRFRRLTVETSAAGGFAFAGLPPDWHGTLGFPFGEPYWMRAEGSSLRLGGVKTAVVPAPTESVVLALSRLPALRGRVLWRDGRPAAGAVMSTRPFYRGGRSSRDVLWQVDADGRFETGLDISNAADEEAWSDDPARHMVIDKVVVSWRHDEARAENERVVAGAELGLDYDLGDLYLDPAPALHVLVQDPRGAPIAGAVVEGRHASAPTDAAGRGVVLVEDMAQRAFRIGAPGCLVARYDADGGAGTADDPLRLTLRPGNRLTVRVRPAELACEELRLEAHSAAPPFTAAGERLWRPSSMHVAAGSSPSRLASIRSDESSGEAYYELDERGEVTLASVVPGLPVRLRVQDVLGQTVHERSVELPAAGESAIVELELDDRVADLRGTVTLDGQPLARAHVLLRGDDRGTGREAADDGTFAMRLFASGAPIRVEVEHPDAAPLHTELVCAAGTLRPTLALRRGHELEVRVLDANGAPVDAVVTLAERAFGRAQSRLGPGHVRFRQLPGEALTLRARIGGRTFEQSADPATARTAEIRVPVLGRVRLRLPDDVGTDRLVLRLQHEDGASPGFEETLVRGTGGWTPDALSLFPGTYRVTCRRERQARAEGPVWSATWTVEAGDDATKSVLF